MRRPHFAASYLDLTCLLRPVCPNAYGKDGILQAASNECPQQMFLFMEKLEMCQYDTDAPAQCHPYPHAGIFLKYEVVKKGHDSHNNWHADFTLNQTWPIFYDYIHVPVYKTWIQYTNLFFKNISKRKHLFEGEEGP